MHVQAPQAFLPTLFGLLLSSLPSPLPLCPPTIKKNSPLQTHAPGRRAVRSSRHWAPLDFPTSDLNKEKSINVHQSIRRRWEAIQRNIKHDTSVLILLEIAAAWHVRATSISCSMTWCLHVVFDEKKSTRAQGGLKSTQSLGP